MAQHYPFQVRRAAAGDAATLSAVSRTTFTATFGHLYRPEDLNAFLDEKHSFSAYDALLSDSNYGLWLVERDGAAVGYAVAGPCSLPAPNLAPRSGELLRLYLDASAIGTGVGARLMKAALDFLDAHFDDQYLSVYAENVRAQRFYARFGFEKIKEYFYMVGAQADPEWIMKRRT